MAGKEELTSWQQEMVDMILGVKPKKNKWLHIPRCCPDCGGKWEGNGYSTPIHCEEIECPQDREPDSDPLPCGFRVKGEPDYT